jgi:hypothetical protein
MSDQTNSPEPRGLTAMNGWWAASGFVILLVILGVVAVLIWGGNDPAPTSQPAATSTSAPSKDGEESVPTNDQEALSSAPKTTTWQSFHGLITLPVSASAGPSTQDGPLWSGWSRTATGALMAATYLVAGTDGPEAATVMKTHSIDGPAAQAYIAKVTASPKVSEPGTTPVIGGFRFVTYTPDAAKVELLLLGPDVALSMPVDLVWQDGDWKIDFEPAGEQPRAVEIGGTSGFVLWSAE